LTRYPQLPLLNDKGESALSADDITATTEADGSKKSLTKYVFMFPKNEDGTTNYGAERVILSKTEADTMANGPYDGYFHFITDPRDIVKNYSEVGVKIIMDAPTLTTGLLGGRRQTQRKRRQNRRQSRQQQRQSRQQQRQSRRRQQHSRF